VCTPQSVRILPDQIAGLPDPKLRTSLSAMDLAFLDRVRYLMDVDNSLNLLQYIIQALSPSLRATSHRSRCTLGQELQSPL